MLFYKTTGFCFQLKTLEYLSLSLGFVKRIFVIPSFVQYIKQIMYYLKLYISFYAYNITHI